MNNINIYISEKNTKATKNYGHFHSDLITGIYYILKKYDKLECFQDIQLIINKSFGCNSLMDKLWSQIFHKKIIYKINDLKFENTLDIFIEIDNKLYEEKYIRTELDNKNQKYGRILKEYSDFMIKFFNLTRIDNPSKITVLRRNDREAFNIENVIDYLRSKYDVQEYYFERMTIKQQIACMLDTKIFLATQGGGIANSYYMNERTSIIEMIPYNIKHEEFKNSAKILNQKYYLYPYDKLLFKVPDELITELKNGKEIPKMDEQQLSKFFCRTYRRFILCQCCGIIDLEKFKIFFSNVMNVQLKK